MTENASPPKPSHGPGFVRSAQRGRRIIVVSGAKGGVGKTVFAANLALYLATIGRRVVLVDADSVGANAHTILGCERPKPSPHDELGAEVETAVPGLKLLRAGLDRPATGGHRAMRRSRLIDGIKTLDTEYVVVDAGAGTVTTLIDFYLSADLAVYLTLPEPTAIENTYRFLRGAYSRLLRARMPTHEARKELFEHVRELGGAPFPLDLVRHLERAKSPLLPLAKKTMDTFIPRVVMNQCRVRADLELGDEMQSAVYRRFGLGIDYLGHIELDDTVWSCVRNRRPVLVESPGTKASKAIEKIARRLLAIDAGKERDFSFRRVPFESHHDMLEVDRGATDEEVRRAYKRAKEIYATDSLACYALFDAKEMSALRVRLDEAYDVLLDPQRRRPYEMSVFPELPDQALPPSSRPAHTEPLPPAPEISPDTDFNGALLKAVRESRGLELKEISARTKIGTMYLKAIEEDDFPMLPAPVYVRGFVAEFAKALSLDAEQVCRSYVRRYIRHVEEKSKV